MDHHRFDALTRRFAIKPTRRALMQYFAGTTVAAFIAEAGSDTARGASSSVQAEATVGPGTGCGGVEICGPNQFFSEESCSCVCNGDCLPNFAPDPESCICYCTLGDSYVCPRPDQVYDDNSCECVCANDECPGDAFLDPGSCLCYCPENIACPVGEAPNPTTCECECVLTCAPPFELDERGCECECNLTCEGSFDLDEDACACVCDETCDEGFDLDENLCECVCNEKCELPFELDEGDCKCICGLKECDQEGYIVDDEKCECVCEVRICDEPLVFDPKTCDCVCPPNLACIYYMELDPETCKCICPPDLKCRADQKLNPETCQCGCPTGTGICKELCIPLCLPTEAHDADCRCEPIVCPPDRVLTCTCECPPGTAECKEWCLPACPPKQVFDASCRCVCQPEIACAIGRKLDPKTCDCVCEELTCRSPKVPDAKTCGCVCPPVQACVSGEIQNPVTCACSCKPGALLDTIEVPCDGSSVSSTTTLKPGVSYTLRASGWCPSGSGSPPAFGVDAQHTFSPQDPIDFILPIDRCIDDLDFGVGIDDPVVDTTRVPQWGGYRPNHIYSTKFTGKGAPISANLHDCDYSKSGTKGTLKIEIFCPDSSGSSDNTGVGSTGVDVGGCAETCPPNKVANDRCECVCPATACPQGKVLDSISCECVCAIETCPNLMVLDANTCICTCPTGIACQKGETFIASSCDCVCEPGRLLDTINVPCKGTIVKSSFTLAKGVHYKVQASGMCYLGYKGHPNLGPDGDAEYGFDGFNAKNLGAVIDRCPSSSDLGIGIDHAKIELTKTPNWGVYNSSHIYSIDFAGKGEPISLNYHDCAFSDNQGTLTVEIFCPPTKL